MLFLSPLFLWGLFAASIPVIIHLINRRRHQTIQWAAMQFLLKATRESRGKRKLRNILILACRCLIIGGLVAAAARPVMSGLMGWGGGSVETVVLVLDRSASMEIKPGDGLESRRDVLLSQVRDAVADIGSPRLVLIDSASGQPLEVSSPDVLPQLSAAAATDTSANIPQLINRAAEFLTDVPGRSEVWVVSDLQESNWRVQDEAWAAAKAGLSSLPGDPRLRVLALTGNTAPNVSVRLLGVSRAGDQLTLQVEVQRMGKRRGPISVPLTINLNGASTTESLTLTEQWLRFQKTIRLPEGAENGHGWLSVPADGNARDNVAFFAYGPSREKRVLVVSAPGEAAAYLALAAAPPGLDGLAVQSVTPETAEPAIDADLVAILWAAPLPDGTAALALQRYLTAGGQVLFLPPGNSSGKSFMDISWAAPVESEAGSYFILKDWSHDDGLLRDGLDGTSIPGARLKAIRRQIPQGDLIPLARWEDEEPALARRIVDLGTAWFLGSLPDYTWSNLGDADVLLPAVQRMMDEGAKRFDREYFISIGPEANRLFVNRTVLRLDDYGSSSSADAFHQSGVFQIDGRAVALNRPADEDEPDILTQEKLATVLEGTRYTYLGQSGAADEGSISKEVWRAFLVAGLLFLLAEAWLCLPKATVTVVLPTQPAGA